MHKDFRVHKTGPWTDTKTMDKVGRNGTQDNKFDTQILISDHFTTLINEIRERIFGMTCSLFESKSESFVSYHVECSTLKFILFWK